MGVLLVALALTPWTHPLAFRALPGWHTGASGNARSIYVGPSLGASVLESAAWIVTGVRYRDIATADPPNATLAHLPPDGVIVWAVIYTPIESQETPITLDLRRATHLRCCDGPVMVPGGDYDLVGYGPGHTYSVIVRVYFGSLPTSILLQRAQRALDQLQLPPSR